MKKINKFREHERLNIVEQKWRFNVNHSAQSFSGSLICSFAKY